MAFLQKRETLNRYSYTKILEDALLPYVDATFGRPNCIYMQDGASCHSANYTKQQLTGWGITVADWAPSSPDLNPIEFCWRELKLYLRNEAKPTTRDGLENAIDFWWSHRLTKQSCNLYIDHAINNYHKVFNSLGGPIIDGVPRLYN